MIDFPGAIQTYAIGINNSGKIVGYYRTATGSGGFLWDAGGNFIAIDVPGGVGTIVRGINDRGDIVGSYFASGESHGFFRDADGNFTTIDVPGAIGTIVNGINKFGSIVGQYTDAAGTTHGFVRDVAGNITAIDSPGINGITVASGINDAGKIAGYHRYYPIPNDFRNWVVDGFIASPTAEKLIKDLINTVNSLDLNKGISTGLDAKLQAALGAASTSDVTPACRIMNAFSKEVSAQSGKMITTEQADQMRAAALQIKDAIGCQ